MTVRNPSGRPTIYDQKMKRFTFRMNHEQIAFVLKMGGAPWLRALIEREITKEKLNGKS